MHLCHHLSNHSPNDKTEWISHKWHEQTLTAVCSLLTFVTVCPSTRDSNPTTHSKPQLVMGGYEAAVFYKYVKKR